ncbi:ankyrin repeat-containing domain protein [Tricladium varicosporioides]|nr:ankyrin repeat-containing domain protein [Hymenoscyphus varicosporioides]
MSNDRNLEVGNCSEYGEEAMEVAETQAFLDSMVMDEIQLARLSGDVAEMCILLTTRNLPPRTEPSQEMRLTLRTAISRASQRNNTEKVRSLFEYFVDDPTIPVLTVGELSEPLKSAVGHENRDMVNILLRQGARVTRETENGLSLKRQYDAGTFSLILDDLLKSGWDIDRGSILWHAAISGHEFLVNWALEHWANPLSTSWMARQPPAMYFIALNCSPATLQLCFDNGSRVHNSALVAAARRKPSQDRTAIFEMLLKYGGDINALGEPGFRRISSNALQASNARALRPTALYEAAKVEDVELVQWLMEHGANPLVRVFRDRPAGTPAGIMRRSSNLVLRDIGKRFCD